MNAIGRNFLFTLSLWATVIAANAEPIAVRAESPDQVFRKIAVGDFRAFSRSCINVSYEIETTQDGDVQLDYFSSVSGTSAQTINAIKPGKNISKLVVAGAGYGGKYKYRIVGTQGDGAKAFVRQNTFVVYDKITTRSVRYGSVKSISEALEKTNDPTSEAIKKGMSVALTKTEDPIGVLLEVLSAPYNSSTGLAGWLEYTKTQANRSDANPKSGLNDTGDLWLSMKSGGDREDVTLGSADGFLPVRRITRGPGEHFLSSELTVEYFSKSELGSLPYYPKRFHYSTFFTGSNGKKMMIETNVVVHTLEVSEKPTDGQFALDSLPKIR